MPVARSALPISVPKNQYMATMITSARTMPMASVAMVCVRLRSEATRVKMVSAFRSGVFDLPMIRKLTDQSDIWVRIPARMAGMSNSTWSSPVTSPATIPARVPSRMATMGSRPKPTEATAATLPPKAKLPSTVRSAISSILKVTKTPSTMMPQRIPWEAAPKRASCMRFLQWTADSTNVR